MPRGVRTASMMSASWAMARAPLGLLLRAGNGGDDVVLIARVHHDQVDADFGAAADDVAEPGAAACRSGDATPGVRRDRLIAIRHDGRDFRRARSVHELHAHGDRLFVDV